MYANLNRRKDVRMMALKAGAAIILAEGLMVNACSSDLSIEGFPNASGGSAQTGGDSGVAGSGGHAGMGGNGGIAGSGGQGGVAGSETGGAAGMGGQGGVAGMGGNGGSPAGGGGSGGFAGAGGGGPVPCPGVFNDTRTGAWNVGVDVPLGGYNIRYTGPSGADAGYDVRCTANGNPVRLGLTIATFTPTDVNVPEDSKKVHFSLTGGSASVMNGTINTANYP
ncbi:MAG: hypothetical protein U0R44_06085 [Candidatus Micrarchaeia archaeon]